MKTPTTRKRKRRREDLPTHAHTYSKLGLATTSQKLRTASKLAPVSNSKRFYEKKKGMPLGDRLVPRV